MLKHTLTIDRFKENANRWQFSLVDLFVVCTAVAIGLGLLRLVIVSSVASFAGFFFLLFVLGASFGFAVGRLLSKSYPGAMAGAVLGGTFAVVVYYVVLAIVSIVLFLSIWAIS